MPELSGDAVTRPCQELVSRLVGARLPTEHGDFQLTLYRDAQGKEQLALALGDTRAQDGLLVRVHSECFTGDVLGSRRCDCGPQLQQALRMIGRAGRGLLIYLRQEGRGIGLPDKLRAYNLQDLGLDTVDANLRLGHPADAREYSVAALILRDLGVSSVDLITNNPRKISGLEELGVVVRSRVPLQVPVGPEGAAYLETKARRMDHVLSAWPDGWETSEPFQSKVFWLGEPGPHPLLVRLRAGGGALTEDSAAADRALVLGATSLPEALSALGSSVVIRSVWEDGILWAQLLKV